MKKKIKKQVEVQLKLDGATIQSLKAVAKLSDQSVSVVVTVLLALYIVNHKKDKNVKKKI